jgi:hypothetical protein
MYGEFSCLLKCSNDHMLFPLADVLKAASNIVRLINATSVNAQSLCGNCHAVIFHLFVLVSRNNVLRPCMTIFRSITYVVSCFTILSSY